MALRDICSVAFFAFITVFAFLLWPFILIVVLFSVPPGFVSYISGLYVVYFLYIYFDNSSETGGRAGKGQWLKWTFPNCQRVHNYFPIKLVKTSDLPPTTNYMLIAHPHTPFLFHMTNFIGDSSRNNQLFPNLTRYIAALPYWFNVPWIREFYLFYNFISCSRESIDFVLNQQPKDGKSNAVVIFIGGGREAQVTAPKSMKLLMKNRGFVRMALRHGAALVPVLTFGENDCYERVRSRFMGKIEQVIARIGSRYRVGLGFYSGVLGTFFPHRKAITTVVGGPLPVEKWSMSDEPPRDEINRVYEIYCKELRKLYDQHKRDYDYEEVPLEFV